MSADDYQRLINAALLDLRALRAMPNSDDFADEVFGFHAQQAAEKFLKAWLCKCTGIYPFTHDISYLLRLVEEQGENIDCWLDLIDLNSFAVQFRYETMCDMDEPLERQNILELLAKLRDFLTENSY